MKAKVNSSVTLERVEVKGLFSRFDYDISFSALFKTSIIIAPNGCGKTTIFKLIDFVFNPAPAKYMALVNIPFDSFACHLSNGKSVTIRRVKLKWESDDERKPSNRQFADLRPDLRLICEANGLPPYNFEVSVCGKKVVTFGLTGRFVSGEYGYADAASADSGTFTRMPGRIQMGMRRHSIGGILSDQTAMLAQSLNISGCSISVAFIDANRLRPVKVDQDENWRHRHFEESQESRDPIKMISEDASKRYLEILAEYNDIQQEMKNLLPRMYLKGCKRIDDFETFKQRWEAYTANVDKYCEVGLLRENDAILGGRELKRAYDEKSEFLQVYLEAFEKTLKPLEKYYRHIKLFLDILNKRNEVTRKSLKFSDKGLLMTMDGEPIPLSCLSSGEKNDLVMFYNLIFNSMDGGVVLVDEPEISLHIAWQQEYLDWLLKICELNNIQAIVATHSPSIVNGHGELYAKMEVKQ